MKSLFTVLIVTAVVTLTASAETLKLSKEGALVRALERNLGIKIEQSRLDIAAQGVELEKGAFDPTVSASFTARDVDGQNADSISAGVDGLTATGGTYSVGVSSDERLINPNRFDSFAGVTFRQPLLRNFGFAQNLAALRIARYQFDLSEWEYKQVLLDTLASTVFAYNNLYEAQQNLVSAMDSRDLAEQLVKDNKKRVELGAIPRLEIVEAEAQLASREERVLSVTNSVLRSQNLLKQLIFDDVEEALSTHIEVAPYMEPVVAEDFGAFLATLLENSPSFHIGEIALEIARLRHLQDRNGTLPSLDLIAQYGFSGNGGSLGGSIENAIRNGDDTYSVGASFSFPVFNRSARAREAISGQRLRIAETDLQSIKQAIQLEFHTSYETMQTNYQRVEATRKARELAEQSLEAENKKFNAGTSSTFFVLRLQSDLSLSQLREISAIANYNRSVADFNRLRGVLE